jgi:hypothetical protein
MSHGIGGRSGRTYSVLKDNQFGEGNFTRQATNPINNQPHQEHACVHDDELCACTTRTRTGDQSARRAAPSHQCTDGRLPFGKGKKWGPIPRWI